MKDMKEKKSWYKRHKAKIKKVLIGAGAFVAGGILYAAGKRKGVNDGATAAQMLVYGSIKGNKDKFIDMCERDFDNMGPEYMDESVKMANKVFANEFNN